MKIRMLTTQAGVDFTRNPGDAVEVGDNEGRALCDAGAATELSDTDYETAVAPAPESTFVPRGETPLAETFEPETAVVNKHAEPTPAATGGKYIGAVDQYGERVVTDSKPALTKAEKAAKTKADKAAAAQAKADEEAAAQAAEGETPAADADADTTEA